MSLSTSVLLQTNFVSDFNHRGNNFAVNVRTVSLVVDSRGDFHGGLHRLDVLARAALLLRLSSARRRSSGRSLVAAAQRALRLGAVGGLVAQPSALGSRASGLAVRSSGSANSLATSRQANVLADGASTSLAVVTRATNFALGFLATNIALSFGQLLATQFTLRLFALGLADSGTRGLIAVPCAIGEAVALSGDFSEGNSVLESNVQFSRS